MSARDEAVGAWPPLGELLPHAGPMRLLDRVVAHDGEETVCAVLPAASALFADATGSVPAWVAVEWMAQCAAAHGGLLALAQGGLLARTRGKGPRAGLFVGSRRLAFRSARFAHDVELRVRARFGAGRGNTLAFDCAVEDPGGGPPLAEGRLNVLLLREPA